MITIIAASIFFVLFAVFFFYIARAKLARYSAIGKVRKPTWNETGRYRNQAIFAILMGGFFLFLPIFAISREFQTWQAQRSFDRFMAAYEARDCETALKEDVPAGGALDYAERRDMGEKQRECEAFLDAIAIAEAAANNGNYRDAFDTLAEFARIHDESLLIADVQAFVDSILATINDFTSVTCIINDIDKYDRTGIVPQDESVLSMALYDCAVLAAESEGYGYATALTDLVELIVKYPDSDATVLAHTVRPVYQYEYGVFLLAEGETDAAITELTRLIEEYPDHELVPEAEALLREDQ